MNVAPYKPNNPQHLRFKFPAFIYLNFAHQQLTLNKFQLQNAHFKFYLTLNVFRKDMMIALCCNNFLALNESQQCCYICYL